MKIINAWYHKCYYKENVRNEGIATQHTEAINWAGQQGTTTYLVVVYSKSFYKTQYHLK